MIEIPEKQRMNVPFCRERNTALPVFKGKTVLFHMYSKKRSVGSFEPASLSVNVLLLIFAVFVADNIAVVVVIIVNVRLAELTVCGIVGLFRIFRIRCRI